MTAARPGEAAATTRIALSLIAHTNVGKTTLARTLLRQDVGEVRDEAHVTLEAERHLLIDTASGDRLELWDTPGFGDSVRLAKRLEQASRFGNAIGWFLSEVWDRFQDRAFWTSQRAVRNIVSEADLVLYLINASEAPEDVGYLDAELRVLALIGKPVLVLLNQMGAPRSPRDEAAEVQRWRTRTHNQTHASGVVREVLALDAFARCWVQEGRLLQAVRLALPVDRRAVCGRLQTAWQQRGRGVWQQSMRVLAERLVRAALDSQAVAEHGWTGKVVELGSAVGTALGWRRDGGGTPREQAMRQLAERLDTDIRSSTDRLIQLHGLSGHATDQVLTRLAEHYAVDAPLHEGKAAMLGGMLTGALAGLKADIATGGITLGGGLLAGGVLGALGAAGLARGYNLVRGAEAPVLTWTDAVLDDLTRAAMLGYLAVAHYGRGRGDWQASEHPDFWADAVESALAPRQAALQALWSRRAPPGSTDAERLTDNLQRLLEHACAELLAKLYPDSPRADATAG